MCSACGIHSKQSGSGLKGGSPRNAGSRLKKTSTYPCEWRGGGLTAAVRRRVGEGNADTRGIALNTSEPDVRRWHWEGGCAGGANLTGQHSPFP